VNNTAKKRKVVLTPDHNFWRALGIRLNDSLLHPNERCYGDLRFTKKILKSLPGIDVEETMSSFKKIGGNCDCHVLHSIVGINVMETAVRSGY
jgi:hypothetical protein